VPKRKPAAESQTFWTTPSPDSGTHASINWSPPWQRRNPTLQAALSAGPASELYPQSIVLDYPMFRRCLHGFVSGRLERAVFVLNPSSSRKRFRVVGEARIRVQIGAGRVTHLRSTRKRFNSASRRQPGSLRRLFLVYPRTRNHTATTEDLSFRQFRENANEINVSSCDGIGGRGGNVSRVGADVELRELEFAPHRIGTRTSDHGRPRSHTSCIAFLPDIPLPLLAMRDWN